MASMPSTEVVKVSGAPSRARASSRVNSRKARPGQALTWLSITAEKSYMGASGRAVRRRGAGRIRSGLCRAFPAQDGQVGAGQVDLQVVGAAGDGPAAGARKNLAGDPAHARG